MRTELAELDCMELGSVELGDRIPVPFIGFLSGAVISLGLWAVIVWAAFTILR